eukprot:TRINITY_DN4949_c0_g1_i1.p1 TRINITY_DN4949_c0_g1~~TRINITY_DN4949_c0_g1_i1.p1  ORF type:complete len:232 (-),score=44.83 TRINITY_DN4949_c0_g1_i1:81-776(-)
MGGKSSKGKDSAVTLPKHEISRKNSDSGPSSDAPSPADEGMSRVVSETGDDADDSTASDELKKRRYTTAVSNDVNIQIESDDKDANGASPMKRGAQSAHSLKKAESPRSQKPRAKSVMVDTSKTEWGTVQLNSNHQTEDKKFSEKRKWRESRGVPRSENPVKNLMGTYQLTSEGETQGIMECADCSKRFDLKDKKFFCAQCEQIFCKGCLDKRKVDEDGNKVWVCKECFWG